MSTALTRATVLPCFKKLAYKTKKDAEEATKWCQQREYVAYKRKYCRKFHITFP